MDQVLLLLMKSIEVLVAVSPIRIRGRIKVRVFLTHNVTEVVVEAVAVVVELVGGDHSLVTDLTSETEISMRLKVCHFFRNLSRFFFGNSIKTGKIFFRHFFGHPLFRLSRRFPGNVASLVASV